MSVTKESAELEGGQIELRETPSGKHEVVLLTGGCLDRIRYLMFDSEKDARAAFHLLSELTQSLK